MRQPRYEVYRSASFDWRWRLKAANGEVLASGEGYTRRQDAVRGVNAHRRAALRAELVFVG